MTKHGPTWWPTSDGAPPRFATRRNLDRPTDGLAVAAVGRRLGTPLTPAQQYVADVAEERRPDGSFEYQIVIWTVPRQTGKTTLLRAAGTKSALQGRDCFYTAQTGKDARARWMDLVKILRVTPGLRDRVKIALRGGSEHVVFPGGGVFQAFAPTPESLHGYTPPRVMLDEAFAHSASVGELLMGAIEPAQQTITDRQLWIVSTMGTAESVFLHDWIDRAREGVPRVALFDWGASDDMDVFDPRAIEAFHPGVGQVLNGKRMTADDILAAADRMSRAEFERAYANRRTSTAAQLIPAETFRALLPEAGFDPPTDPRGVTLAYDVDEFGAAGAIVAVWARPDGTPAATIVRREPGTAWMTPALIELDSTWRPAAVVAAGNGPVLDVNRDLTDAGVNVEVLGEREFAIATSELLTVFRDAGPLEVGDTEGRDLELSVTGLVTRSSVVDGVAFSRRHSVGSSAAGVALAVGLHSHRHRRDGVPLVRFAS